MISYTLLHLDDDELELRQFKKAIATDPLFQVISCQNMEIFLQKLKHLPKIDFVILDLFLNTTPQQQTPEGLSLVEKIRRTHPQAVIVMSSNADEPEVVLQCLRLGADEFLSKSTPRHELIERLHAVYRSAKLKHGEMHGTGSFLFAGKTMQKIANRIPPMVHSAVVSVYIEGESGTGKEVVADLFAQHTASTPFVRLNCGSIAPNLLESELFGHARGAFTGAMKDKAGMIETASGGWLFLDEVSSLSLSAQVALLRVLENQEVTRLGETRSRKVDVRFLSASNEPLADLVEKGTFRNDLWQRLRETEIFLPPLRQRVEELPEIVGFFCKIMKGGPYSIDKSALNILCKLSWKEGNIRELRNCLRAMTEHAVQNRLSPMGIPARYLLTKETPHTPIARKDTEVVDVSNHKALFITDLRLSNKSFKTWQILTDELLKAILVQEAKYGKINVAKLAKELGLARSTLHLKIQDLFADTER